MTTSSAEQWVWAGLPAAPDGLPLLAAGQHLTPADGACFMEFASVLAGEPFGDHPRCTHPLLAALARGVNDRVDDATRQRLLPLVPAVVGVRGPSALLSAVVVAAVTRRALVQDPHSRPLRAAHARATARLPVRRPGLARWWLTVSDLAYRRGAGLLAVDRAIHAVAGAEPTAMYELLASTISAAGLAAAPRSAISPPRGDSALAAGPSAPPRA